MRSRVFNIVYTPLYADQLESLLVLIALLRSRSITVIVLRNIKSNDGLLRGQIIIINSAIAESIINKN